MQYLNLNKSGFIRYSTLAIFWISMSLSSFAFGEFNEYDEEDAPENAEYIPIVYSGAAITMGAHATIFGNIQSVAAVTLGEAAALNGNLLSGAAVTLDKDGVVIGNVTVGEDATFGAISLVIGDVTSGATVFVGAESEISGDLQSRGGTTLGAAAKVGGNVTAGTFVTLGASAQVGQDESLGNVRAYTGPIVLGANAAVKGIASSGTYISLGDNAQVHGSETQYVDPDGFTHEAKAPVATKKDQLTQMQQDFADTSVPTSIELITTIAANRDFYPGVYHASALTTAARTTLTFIGSGYGEPDEWLINVDTYISFGANVTINLVDVAQGSTIIFNAGTYTTIGANSIFRGTIFADTYITTGANTTITGVGSDCGGLFATNGAITMGAHSTFGASGCWQARQQNEEDDEYYAEGYYDGEYENGEFNDYECDDYECDDGECDDGEYDDGEYDEDEDGSI
jgi:acetyltransferase-like isoleucine patch superfamily enzyme